MENLCRLSRLDMRNCSKLEVLLTNINLESLGDLDLSYCSLLKRNPKTSTNTTNLKLSGTQIKEVPSSMRSRLLLSELEMSYSEVQELGPWIWRISRLYQLILSGMHKLVSLLQLPYSLKYLDADNCKSLERLDCSFRNPAIRLNFAKCFKLNQEARDLIIHTPTNQCVVLPGGEVPTCFTYRAFGNFITVKLNQKPLRTSTKFKACILVAEKNKRNYACSEVIYVNCSITSIENALLNVSCKTLKPVFVEHLYTFEVEAEEVTSTELVFEFEILTSGEIKYWEIKECGIFQLTEG